MKRKDLSSAGTLPRRPTRLPPPFPCYANHLAPHQKAMLDSVLACTAAGSPDTVRRGLREFIERTGADEVMVTSQIHDHAARLRSYEILAGLLD